MRVSVYGSAEEEREEVMRLAYRLGEVIAGRGHTLITGACGGVPLEAVKGAHTKGGGIIGYSPARNLEEHRNWGMPEEGHTDLVFVPKTYEHAGHPLICRKYRNISSVAACDAAIFIAGKVGTLNEFTIAYDLGRLIGVLTGSGGVTDLLNSIVEALRKEPRPCMVFSSDPLEILSKFEKYALQTPS